jgi:hypothetical protein
MQHPGASIISLVVPSKYRNQAIKAIDPTSIFEDHDSTKQPKNSYHISRLIVKREQHLIVIVHSIRAPSDSNVFQLFEEYMTVVLTPSGAIGYAQGRFLCIDNCIKQGAYTKYSNPSRTTLSEYLDECKTHVSKLWRESSSLMFYIWSMTMDFHDGLDITHAIEDIASVIKACSTSATDVELPCMYDKPLCYKTIDTQRIMLGLRIKPFVDRVVIIEMGIYEKILHALYKNE